jgi:PAS domain S-box-containing protein
MAASGVEDKLLIILDSLDEAYYEFDITGCMIFVNQAFCRLIGCGSDEIVGKQYSDFLSSESAGKIHQSIIEVSKSGMPARFDSWHRVSKVGRKKKIEFSISPIIDESERLAGFRGIVRDMTEKDRIEKELIRARKLEAIGIISGGIAHDYNNALTAILGNISLAKMEAGQDNTNLIELLNDAEAASLKAVELTRRLSTIARGGKPDRKVMDYSDSLRGIVDSVLNGYHGKYELNIQDGLYKVDIDEFQINQAVSYILNNAVESMPEPGVIQIFADNIIVEAQTSQNEISLQPGNYLRILIIDQGEGIPPDVLHNIFDPYFTTKEMGSGMGLTTSYAIIKRHHGYIDVKSSVGRGSTFSVYLPEAQT